MRFFKVRSATLGIAILFALLLVGSGSPGTIFAKSVGVASCTSGIVNSPSPGSEDILRSVAYISPTDIWAAGSYTDNKMGYSDTLIENWNGVQWSVVSSPNIASANNYLYGISADSASDIWAVGYYSTGYEKTLIEHWDGSSWSIVSSPNPGSGFNDLYGVVAINSSDAWAVGQAVNQSQSQGNALIEQWNGHEWDSVTSASPGAVENTLYSVSAVNANDIWAVGDYANTKSHEMTLTEHWNGSSWSYVQSPTVGRFANFLYGVAAISTSDVWAVGFNWAAPGNISQTLTEHWDGTQWTVVSSPNPPGGDNVLNGVFAVAPNDVWAVGGSNGETLAIKWDGTQWNVETSYNRPNAGNGLLAISGPSVKVLPPTELWSVGFSVSNQTFQYQTLTERFCQ